MGLEKALKKENKKFFSGAFKKIKIGIAALALGTSLASCDIDFIPRISEPEGEYFSMIILPDTQVYMDKGPEIFYQQMGWINEAKEKEQIVSVMHMGDIVESGNSIEEWGRAKKGINMLDKDIPVLLTVGNNDQWGNSNPDGTENFNKFFGYMKDEPNRGFYGKDIDNSYLLFECKGHKFLTLSLEYHSSPEAIDWADKIIQKYSDREAIIVSHSTVGNDDGFSPKGREIYEKVKDNSNVILMLGGHIGGECYGRHKYSGNVVYSILSDYQGPMTVPGGWIRIMKFYPECKKIKVQTYSPCYNRFRESHDSEFIIDWE